MTSRPVFTQHYRKSCFDAWYLAGRPSYPSRIREIIPADEEGRKPSSVAIRRWMIEGSWDEWADQLDAQVSLKSDKELINEKVKILKVHQRNAAKLAEKAHVHLMTEEFDSSSAAVNAYFKATEEERKIAGFTSILERIEQMDDNKLTQEIIDMLNRASDNDQIIDAQSVPELEDGEEESQE